MFEKCFGINSGTNDSLKLLNDNNYLSIPFNIREEPFGLLLVGEKTGADTFDSEDEFILKFMAERTALNIENMALYDNLMQNLMASLMSLVGAIEAKDKYTQQHTRFPSNSPVDTAPWTMCTCKDPDF